MLVEEIKEAAIDIKLYYIVKFTLQYVYVQYI